MGVNKSKSAFRSIAEVTEDLGIAPHVLRFWETKFTQIKPMKTKSSRRYYRPDDVELLALIKELLYNRRYTIEGVQKLFKNRTLKDILGTEIQKDFFEEDGTETPAVNEPLAAAVQNAINSLKEQEMSDTEQRFINIEMALSNLERTVEDLNEVIIRQGRDIAFLQKQNRYLTEALRNTQSTVKPEEEETPPPHY